MALIAHYLCNNPEVLPKEYVRVEYLQTDGNSAILTKELLNTTDYFEMKFQITTGTLNGAIAGSLNGNTDYQKANNFSVTWMTNSLHNPLLSIYFHSANSTVDYAWRDTLSHDNGIYTILYLGLNIAPIVNGRQMVLKTPTTFIAITPSVPWSLFGRSTTSGNRTYTRSGIRIWYFRGRNFNYVPCKRKSDNAYGMYEMVTGVFYPNVGTGTFTAGPEITESTEVNATGGDGTLVNLDINTMSHVNRQSTCSKTVDSNGVMTVTLNSITSTNPGIYFKNCLFSGVDSGHTYTWQVYLRTDKSGGMVIQQLGVTGGNIFNASINSEWQKFENTFTFNSASRNVVFYCNSAAANGDSFQIKDFRVVRGNVTSPLLPGSNGTLHNVSIVKSNDLPLYDYCYEFNGTNSYISTNWDLSKYPLNHYTLSCWVKHDILVSTTKSYPIIRSSAVNTVTIDVYCSLNLYYYRGFHFTSTGNNLSNEHNVLVPDRNWHLLTLTFDGSTKKLYLDSVLKNTCSSDAPVSSGLLYIGAYNNQNMQYFKGFLQDIRIYNEALTAEEIQQLYNLKKI